MHIQNNYKHRNRYNLVILLYCNVHYSSNEIWLIDEVWFWYLPTSHTGPKDTHLKKWKVDMRRRSWLYVIHKQPIREFTNALLSSPTFYCYFGMKILSYQYSHCGDTRIPRLSNNCSGNSYPGNLTLLLRWALVVSNHMCCLKKFLGWSYWVLNHDDRRCDIITKILPSKYAFEFVVSLEWR